MSQYAKVLNGEVVNVIEADASFFNTFVDSSPGTWVETDKHTHAGRSLNGGTPLRFNYASIGGSYDGTGFAAPQPYPSWTLDKTTYTWQPPVAKPTTKPEAGGYWVWDETNKSWSATDPTLK